MIFPHPLTPATFLKREKRFLIHAQLQDGQKVIAHTNNTGSMRGLLASEAEIWLSPANNPARKLPWTLELVRTVENTATGVQGDVLVGVNTIMANHLIREAIQGEAIAGLPTNCEIRAEVKYGQGSRVDFLLTDIQKNRCWVEVKNVSLVENSHARFPDSPTERGRKHLVELETMVKSGDRAALVFCIQRSDPRTVGPADDIDPLYGKLLRQAAANGVEIYGVEFKVDPNSIEVHRCVEIVL